MIETLSEALATIARDQPLVTCLDGCHPVIETPNHVNLAPPEVAHLMRTLAARVTP